MFGFDHRNLGWDDRQPGLGADGVADIVFTGPVFQHVRSGAGIEDQHLTTHPVACVESLWIDCLGPGNDVSQGCDVNVLCFTRQVLMLGAIFVVAEHQGSRWGVGELQTPVLVSQALHRGVHSIPCFSTAT